MNPLLRLRSLFLVAALLCTFGFSANGQCLPQWLYRAPITINNTGPALTDYQVKLIINTSTPIGQGKMKSDGGDIRFVVNPSGTCTAIDNWWVESGMNSGATIIWIKIPSVPNGSSTIYMYYGNPAAASLSNANNVFPLFDDFNGATLDPAKWNKYGSGTVTVTGGAAVFNSNGSAVTIRSIPSLPSPAYIEAFVNSASGNWPNIAQVNENTWNGFTMFLGGSTMWAGRTEAFSTDYQAYLESSAGAGALTGVWTNSWPATGQQTYTWPGGFMSRAGAN